MICICKPEKIQIYVNSKKKTAAQIKAETGCDIIINGGLYNMTTFKPVCHLKVDGKVLAKDQYTYYGYGWDSNSFPVLTTDYTNFDNYICCVCMVKDGKAAKMYYNSDVGGSRQRTAIGTFSDGRLWLYADRTSKTPEQIQDIALKAGVKDSLLLDGGGSTQAIFPSGKVTSLRIVHNYILVYLKESDKTIASANNNSIIKTIQTELNLIYNAELVVDGSWGKLSKKAIIKAVQTEINNLYGSKLVVDGSWGSASKKACPDINKFVKNNLVWLIQACLAVKGYDIDLDGSYGSGTANIVKQFQNKNYLRANGVCGANTMTKLLS